MKIYTVGCINSESGEVYAFPNKRDAQRKKRELEREFAEDIPGDITTAGRQVFDISEHNFPISAKGIIMAYESGAHNVFK